MAVKRNSRITSVVGGIEKRLRSLEITGNLSIPSSLSDLVSTEADSDSIPLDRVRVIPPDTYKKIIGARIYGPAATGNFGTRVELYFEETVAPDPDPNVAVDELEVIISEDEDGKQTLQQIQVYGVNGYSGTPLNLSSGKIFRPIEVAYDDPSWAENGLRGNEALDQTEWRQTPPVSAISGKTVGSTIWYNPVVQDPDQADKNGKDLVVTRAVDSATVTGANVVVTLNASSHLFRVGDVISVDIPAPFIGLDYYGNNEPDGLFQITAVTSNTISYSLDAPVSTTQNYEYDGTTRHYVYAVARPYVEDGTVWTDTSVEPNRVWVWRTYRWYNTAEPIGDVAAEKDGIAPSPVTGLAATTVVPAGSGAPTISLTWTPPTTRSNGAPISGFLDGYDIWYKRSTEAVWKKEFVKDGGLGISSHTLKDATLLQNFTYNIRVYVVDIMAQYSTVETTEIVTATYSEVLNPPSKPTVSSRLGTIAVNWDGEDSAGNLPVEGVLYIEFHASTTSGFTPSTSTLVGTAPPSIGGNYIVVADLTYGQNYYFRTQFVRRINPFELETSDPSVQSDAIQVSRLVNTDIIANTISGAAIQPGTIVASDKIVGNSITGALIEALTIKAGNIDANAINADKLDVGAITGSLIQSKIIELKATPSAAKRIVLSSAGIAAYNGTDPNPTFSFDGQSGSLNAASLVVQNINADYINTGTLSGVTVQTSNSLKRVVLNEDKVKFFVPVPTGNPNIPPTQSRFSGEIDGTYNSGTALFGLNLTGNTAIYLTATGGVSVTDSSGISGLLGQFQQGDFGNISTDIVRRNSGNGQILFQTTAGTTVANVITSTTSSTGTNLWLVGRGSADQWIDRSSRRYKTNIQPFSDPLDTVLNLRVITYQADPHGRLDDDGNPIPLGDITVGLIAEEVAEAGLSSIVAFDPENPEIVEGLDYGRVGVLLIPIVKRLKEELEELKTRLDT